MIIDCISDLHGEEPELEGGDLLIIAGDLTASDTTQQYERFCSWLSLQDHYRKKIVIAGNHDNGMVKISPQKGLDPVNPNYEWFEYLCDSGTEFKGLKIWGSPWTSRFPTINPKCCAFTCNNDEELSEKWQLIPDDTDILITHTAPFGVLDKTTRNTHVGSISLSAHIGFFTNLKLHVFGHIHEAYGKIDPPKYLPNYFDVCQHYSVNASIMNELYKPVNKPVRIIL